MFTKKSVLRFLAFMVMFSAFMPIIFDNLPPVVKSHKIWTSLWLAGIILYRINLIQQKTIVVILSYGGIFLLLLTNTLWASTEEGYIKAVKLEYLDILIAFTMYIHFIMAKDYIGMAHIVKWTLIFILITSIMR